MASFGDSFLDMAEAMLGKRNRSSSFEALATEKEDTNNSTPGLKRVHSDNSHTSTSSSSNNSDPKNDRQINNTSEKMDERRSILVVTPPKRRRRMSENLSAVNAVQCLNLAMSKVSPRTDVLVLIINIKYSLTHQVMNAISQSERIEALSNATTTFDHNNQDLHDTEIELGVDIALVKILVFLEFKASFRREPMKCDVNALTHEVAMTVKCLECVYRYVEEEVLKFLVYFYSNGLRRKVKNALVFTLML